MLGIGRSLQSGGNLNQEVSPCSGNSPGMETASYRLSRIILRDRWTFYPPSRPLPPLQCPASINIFSWFFLLVDRVKVIVRLWSVGDGIIYFKSEILALVVFWCFPFSDRMEIFMIQCLALPPVLIFHEYSGTKIKEVVVSSYAILWGMKIGCLVENPFIFFIYAFTYELESTRQIVTSE